MGDQRTTGVARCGDGSELRFDWVYADAPTFEWVRDTEHWTRPMAPMEIWLWNHGWFDGADRAWAEVDMRPPAVFYRFQIAGPFLYARATPYGPEEMMQIAARYVAVRGEFGGARAFWETYAEPRIQAACNDIAGMGTSAPLSKTAELWGYGFHQTFTSSCLLAVANMPLVGLLTEHAGEQAELIASEVTQGGDNASQAIDREIWEIARIARQSASVRLALESGSDDLDALRHEPDAAQFIAEFEAMIARHGWRSLGWDLLSETWRERPDAVLALIRTHLSGDGVSPTELAERSAERRRAATDLALSTLPAEKHDVFRGLVDQLDGYVFVREGRAYWQMVIAGSVRTALLRRGAELVDAARIDESSDILYLEPGDIDREGDLRGIIAANKAALEQWRRSQPPDILGTPGEAAARSAARRTAELRGSPASRGQVTGTARIVHGPEEAGRLQRGEIMVCVMTTPAWTPLFAIAGGIITETGGALSHPAITAREYGIPAVVAVSGATERIPDGALVTIDGGAGRVSVLAPSSVD